MLTHYYGVYDYIIISGLSNILSHHVQNFSFWNGVKPRILPLSPLGAVLRFSSRFRINALPYIPSTPGSHTPCQILCCAYTVYMPGQFSQQPDNRWTYHVPRRKFIFI